MTWRLSRAFLIGLVLTSAAVAVSAADEDDVDRTDFSDPALQEDQVIEAKDAHSEVEVNWVLPECQDGKIPIGGTSDLLVALSNSGSKMFNVTRIEGHFVKNGEVAIPLDTYTYGQNVEPRQQRSFRFPIALAEDTPLGEYTLVAKIFYATRDKMPFVSPVCDEPTELVPALPKGDTAAMLMQAGIGGLVVLAVGALTMGGGKGGDAGKGGGKGGGRSRDGGSGGGGGGGGGARPAEVESSEWLRGTLAGTESTTPKKAKKK